MEKTDLQSDKYGWESRVVISVLILRLLISSFIAIEYVQINPIGYNMPFALILNCAGTCILGLFSSITANLFLQKSVLMCLDAMIYIVLRNLGSSAKNTFVFYLCSPITLLVIYKMYPNEILGVLSFMVAFLFLCNWRIKQNLILFTIFYILALEINLIVLIFAPLFFIYIIRKAQFICGVKYLAITLGTVMVSFVFHLKELRILNISQSCISHSDVGNLQIIVFSLLLIGVYELFLHIYYIDRLMIFTAAMSITAIVFVCNFYSTSMYLLLVLFITLIISSIEDNKCFKAYEYGLFNVFYVFWFIQCNRVFFFNKLLNEPDTSSVLLKNITFAGVMGLFVCFFIRLFYQGVISNPFFRRGFSSFTIGISGNSGAGKSTLLSVFNHLFVDCKDVLYIEGDGDHKWERGNENWKNYTALDPKANYLYRQAYDVKALKRGICVRRSDYDHETGTFSEKHRVNPQKYIILCGLHSLYLPILRKQLDFKIYLDTDKELQKFWKICRDTKERGYTPEEVIRQIESREYDIKKYIYPQRQYADLVITYFDKTLADYADLSHEVALSLKLQLDMDFFLEDVIHCFEEYGIYPDHLMTEDLLHQELVFHAEEIAGHEVDFERIALKTIPQYTEIFPDMPEWEKGVNGIVQLFVAVIIVKKLRSLK